MADKRTFKWGDRVYLLDDLLALHAAQENNYYNFARDKGKYDDTALQGLRQAITDRINAVKNGQVFEADGSLSTDVVDNVSVKSKNRIFRKDEYTNQDNTAWAKHYLNKLISNLKEYNPNENSNKWDINKFGLSGYFSGQGLNAQDIFSKYDKRDKNNPNAERSFDERNALLKKQLLEHENWIYDQNFNFTENDNVWDDDYLKTLGDLNNNFDTYVQDGSLPQRLRKLGLNDSYITAFTSNRWDLSKTDEELEEESKKSEEEKKVKENTEAYNTAIGNYYGIYSGLNPRTGQMTAYLGQSNSNFYRTPEELLDWAKNNKADVNSYQKRYNENKWDVEAAQYILPMMQTNGRLMEATIDGIKYVYDPNTIDRSNYSFIAINPVTGIMEQRFLYDLENEMNALRNKYLKPQGAAKYQIDVESHKEGGIISMQTGGGFDAVNYLQSLSDSDYKKHAEEKGVDEKVLRESERTPFGEKTVINNSKFTGNDFVQLATMAANIGTIFMDPITGGAAGAGLSTVDFINDISRDGFQWKDAGNYIKNLGMDAIGMLPIIGDTFGTLGKVKKGLFDLAPKIIGYLGMAQGIVNSPQIIDSFSKILDEREMTTADWQNIANGINLIISGSRVGKHAVKKARGEKVSIIPDKLQIEVTDKAGNTKLLVLDGENAKAVKNSDHSVESVNKIIKNIEGMQDYEVSAQSNVFDFSLKMPGRKVKDVETGTEERVWKPYELKPEKASVSKVYDPIKYARAYNSGNASKRAIYKMIRNKNVVDGSGKQNLEQVKQNYEDSLKAAAKNRKEQVDKINKNLPKLDSKIEDINTKINNFNQKINSEKDIINNKISEIESVKKINSQNQKNKLLNEIHELQKEINQLKSLKSQYNSVDDITSIDNWIKDNYTKINNKRNEIFQIDEEIRKFTLEQNNLKKSTEDLIKQRDKLQNLLDNLNKAKANRVKFTTTHSPEFEKLTKLDSEEITFNKIKHKFEKAYKAEDLINDGYFKQGGSINRNKLNKFLNYGKR